MLIPANLHVIFISFLVAFPFYFFNRYLIQKLKPKENAKRLLCYFAVILIAASLYSVIAVFLMISFSNK